MASLIGKAAVSAARAVHIKVSPTPMNLSESREVLRVLQGYGEVVMFRNLRYDPVSAPSTMLAMFRSEDSAKKLLSESPVQFILEPPRDDQLTRPIDGLSPDVQLREEKREQRLAEASALDHTPAEEMIRTSTLLHGRSKKSEGVTADAQRENVENRQPRQFRILADLSTLDHAENINSQPYTGKFRIQPNMIQEDLAQTVPMPGLSEISFHSRRYSRLRQKDRVQVETTPSLGKLYKNGLQKFDAETRKLVQDGEKAANTLKSENDNLNAAGVGKGGWGLGASIQQAVGDVGKIIAGNEVEEERKRKYGG